MPRQIPLFGLHLQPSNQSVIKTVTENIQCETLTQA